MIFTNSVDSELAAWKNNFRAPFDSVVIDQSAIRFAGLNFAELNSNAIRALSPSASRSACAIGARREHVISNMPSMATFGLPVLKEKG